MTLQQKVLLLVLAVCGCWKIGDLAERGIDWLYSEIKNWRAASLERKFEDFKKRAAIAEPRKGARVPVIDYSTNRVPADYICTICHVTGCRLWRPYELEADCIPLLCVGCGAKDQGMEDVTFGRTDRIGTLIPAVPAPYDKRRTYWGYTAVPAEALAWWRRLPLRGVTYN